MTMSFTKRGDTRKCRVFAISLGPMALRWLTAMTVPYLHKRNDPAAKFHGM